MSSGWGSQAGEFVCAVDRQSSGRRGTHGERPQVLLGEELAVARLHHRRHPAERQALEDVGTQPRALGLGVGRAIVVAHAVAALLLVLAETDLAAALDEGHKVAPAHALPSLRAEELEAEKGGEEDETEDQEDELGERGAGEVTRRDGGDEEGSQGDGGDGLREEGPEQERGRGVREERVRNGLEDVGEELRTDRVMVSSRSACFLL